MSVARAPIKQIRIAIPFAILAICGQFAAFGQSDYSPRVEPASDEAQAAIATFRPAEGFRVELFAAEPMLANPIAFYPDRQGRFYVAETFRLHAGVTDMRRHTRWNEDDLASRTPEDRLIAMKKNLGADFSGYTVHHDRIRLIEDLDGDGVADRATVFADGFKDALAGLGAGVLADRGDVFYTCIPDFWKLRDEDGDGMADSRELLSSGYGVHIGFLGHDLHGLRKGPDGRIYFSIGDRGFHVKTPDGLLDYPDTGAVLRCEPDGSNLEVVHTGLRNPQELVFDDFGNLFTGDNNSDGGDEARWVWIVEGGDSGWRIGYQWITDPNLRGPWNAERLWHPQWEGQAAYIVPPLANIAAGPSGLTYYPGTGMPERYRGHFFLCDFRGNAATSLIHSFALRAKGASFEVVDRHDLIEGVLATDVEFGPEAGIYILDWTQGWDMTGKGRIYRLFDPSIEGDALVAETHRLLAGGFEHRDREELLSLLHHADRRVRLEAQWALADLRSDVEPALLALAMTQGDLLPRIHAIWALGQMARSASIDSARLVMLTSDPNSEIRAQAANVLGDLREPAAARPLIALLADPSPRVRFFAAIGLGRIGDPNAAAPIAAMLRENDDEDPYLRHAGVMGLLGSADAETLTALATDESPAVRMAALLAYRRSEDPRIADFLTDPDRRLVVEAARAINDVPIEDAMPALAGLISELGALDSLLARPTVRRVLNAGFRSGWPVDAEALARLAAREEISLPMRIEALGHLGRWADPPRLDRIVGLYRPLAPRSEGVARDALAIVIVDLLQSESERVKQRAAALAAQYRMARAAPSLARLIRDEEQSPKTRAEALAALGKIGSPELAPLTALALATGQGELRSQALTLLAALEPSSAVPLIGEAIAAGTTRERQAAIRTLGAMENADAEQLLADWLDRLIAGEAPPRIHLELIEAAEARDSVRVREKLARYENSFDADDPLAPHRALLAGGRADRGEVVFFEKVEVSCQRCHTVGDRGGGEAGPDLSDIGARASRESILESILDPNREIAEGFENATLTLTDGTILTGRIVEETETTIELEIAIEAEGEEFVEGEDELPDRRDTVTPATEPPQQYERVSLKKDRIRSRRGNLSSMPEDVASFLDRSEIRDLVEYLAGLK